MDAHCRTQGPISLPVAAHGGQERWQPPGVGAVRSALRTSSPRVASPAVASSTAEVPFAAAIRACTPSPGGDFPCFVASPDEVETLMNLSHTPEICSPARGFKFKLLFQCEFEALLRLL